MSLKLTWDSGDQPQNKTKPTKLKKQSLEESLICLPIYHVCICVVCIPQIQCESQANLPEAVLYDVSPGTQVLGLAGHLLAPGGRKY